MIVWPWQHFSSEGQYELEIVRTHDEVYKYRWRVFHADGSPVVDSRYGFESQMSGKTDTRIGARLQARHRLRDARRRAQGEKVVERRRL